MRSVTERDPEMYPRSDTVEKKTRSGKTYFADAFEKFTDTYEQCYHAFMTMRELKPKEIHKSEAVGPEWEESRAQEYNSWIDNNVMKKRRRVDLPSGTAVDSPPSHFRRHSQVSVLVIMRLIKLHH